MGLECAPLSPPLTLYSANTYLGRGMGTPPLSYHPTMTSTDERDLQLRAVVGFNGAVPNGLIIHPDPSFLVYGLGSNLVIRNAVQKSHRFLQGHDNRISCISLSPSGRYIASGQRTHKGFLADVIIWDFSQGVELKRLR